MTPDARVLQFPPSGATRPQDYGQFTRELSIDPSSHDICRPEGHRAKAAPRKLVNAS
jgi:hypothetical protein